MKTVAVHSQKGGSGRSLLSCHLAVEASRAGKSVAVIDIDPQCSAMSWRDTREADAPYVVSVTPARLTRTLDAARADNADLVIIDTAPHSADAAIMAAEASDLILVPCRPAVFDLRTLANTARIAKLTGKPSYVIISQAPRAPKQVEDAIETVKQTGLRVAPVVIHQRVAFSHAITVGLTATELEPCGKASEEIIALYEWLARTIVI